jgi:hypothetical protein
MARDLNHFDLARWREPLPRRKLGGGSRLRRDDRQAHGAELNDKLEDLARSFEARIQKRAEGINPKLIFSIRLRGAGSSLGEEDLSRWGLHLLGRNASGLMVVFPDQESLDELRRRVREYAGLEDDGHAYGELDFIEDVVALNPADRVGPRLVGNPLEVGETIALDIELWHSGDVAECRMWIASIRNRLEALNLTVTDSYVGSTLCLVRARLNQSGIDDLLDPALDFVKQIERRAEPSFEMGWIRYADVVQVEDAIDPPADDLVGILVVDSGVSSRHPLLAPVFADAQTMPRVDAAPANDGGDVDIVTPGHGTAVAGIAAYGDLTEGLRGGRYVPGAILFSARVTDDANQYDAEFLIESQLQSAFDYFLERYPSIKVINISLGDSENIYRDDVYQFRFAAAVDELLYRLRDREVLVVISSGNQILALAEGEEELAAYPASILDAENRVVDPATAAIALTVGGLSYGFGVELDRGQVEDTRRLVAGEKGWPSPFTRSGPGVNGAVKPEVVDFAGDIRFERGRLGNAAWHAGVVTTSRDFAPPDGNLFCTVAGTSFAAPRVSHLAARLFHAFPDASSNLIRCLIAASAEVPASRPPLLSDLQVSDERILRIYGYGQPQYDRARWSAENDVLLLADENVDVDSFVLFELPVLPDTFLSASGCGQLDVTLAFDPPTRHTRLDSYLGIKMQFSLFRNCAVNDVAEAIREFSREEKELLRPTPDFDLKKVKLPGRGELETVDLMPSSNARKRGTLQRGSISIKSRRWKYDFTPMILAIVCQRVWAPVAIQTQRFAAVVTISHENESVRIHEHIRAQARVEHRARAQAQR